MHSVGQLLAVSLIVMGLSHTISRERICEPLRARLGGKETWLGYLVSCPYCVSHWIAMDPGVDLMGVNARLMDPEVLAAARVRHSDGP